MFQNFKDAMSDKAFHKTLMQNVAGAILISTITTILPPLILIVKQEVEVKIAEMKLAKVSENLAAEVVAE